MRDYPTQKSAFADTASGRAVVFSRPRHSPLIAEYEPERFEPICFSSRAMEYVQKPVRFSREEAQVKLGRHVRSIVQFDAVPAGTFGCVMQLDEIEKNNFEVIVEWYVLIEGKRQHDWFSKDQFDQCLIEAPALDLAANTSGA
jgi:hypothetical protein